MRTTICRTYRFEAAHSLPYHQGKCQRIHGHSYVVEVEVSGEPRSSEGDSEHGMVLDFGHLDTYVNEIVNVLDHQNLNEVLPIYPTAENLAAYLFGAIELPGQSIKSGYSGAVEMERVRVWETARSWAEVKRR